MSNVRLGINLTVLVAVTLALSAYVLIELIGGSLFSDPYRIVVPMPDAGGVYPLQQVTVRGHAVGQVAAVDLTREEVRITLEIQPEESVPRRAVVQVLRRSPIGEQAVDFIPVPAGWRPSAEVVPAEVPVDGDWEAAPEGAVIEPVAAVTPASVVELLERGQALFSAIDGDDLATTVTELAAALRHRADTLVELNRDAAELGTTWVAAIPEFERFLATSEDVLDILRDHRHELASGLASAADVSELLARDRDVLEDILDEAPRALGELDTFVRDERADISCLLGDLTAATELFARPEHQEEIARLLDLNRYFYGGFDAGTQWDPYRPGILWARVNILMFEQAAGEPYVPLRPTPPTLPGAACVSPFGVGVDAVRQTDPPPVPPDPTSPGVDYAPRVEGARAGDGGQTGDGAGTAYGDRRPLPATGGGGEILPLALALAFLASFRPRRGHRG